MTESDILREILDELKELNETLHILTDEHFKHFDEWRTKNKGL